MKTSVAKMMIVLCILCLAARGRALTIDDTPKADVAPETVVRAFLKCIPGQQVGVMRTMLADTREFHIVQDSDPAKAGIWAQTWEDWLRWVASTRQSTHVVDKLCVTQISDDLATVEFIGHTADAPRTDLRAIVVLTRKQGGKWLITSWTQENTTLQVAQ